MKTIIIFILVILGAWGCATPQRELMSRVRIGMDKTQVLDVMGSPNHSRYNKGLHEWVYVYDGPHQERIAKKFYFKRSDLIKIEDYDLRGDVDEQILSAESLREYEKSVEKKRADQESGFKSLDE